MNSYYVVRSSRPAELVSLASSTGCRTPASPSVARSPGGLRARTLRNGIHEQFGLRRIGFSRHCRSGWSIGIEKIDFAHRSRSSCSSTIRVSTASESIRAVRSVQKRRGWSRFLFQLRTIACMNEGQRVCERSVFAIQSFITGGRYGQGHATEENHQEEAGEDHDGKAGGEEREEGPLNRRPCTSTIPCVDE
ncbi:MAG: hypothetical protein K0S58_42 [Nitrospira sp.]|nr:hypothetical protein [Nitrospira sp.]